MNKLVSDKGPISRPKNREEGLRGMIEGSFTCPENVTEITFTCHEFTSVCPKTGQPDFGEIEVYYRPRIKCIESRSLKFYLWSYREEGAFCESLASQIAKDVYEAIKPDYVRVTVSQNSRGGIQLTSVAEYRHKGV